MKSKPSYRCTGHVTAKGFAEFLAAELGESRRNLRLFESELRTAFSAPWVTLVNSGSSANLVAAMLLKHHCGTRRRVLLSGFSFPTTVSSYSFCGFEIRLLDVEAGGFNLDPARLKQELDERIAAVVVTHFLGFPASLGEIARQAIAQGALLIQDACETLNLCVQDRSIYEFGDVITHSFYHPHHLSSFGGGGVVVNSKEWHEHAQSLVHWGRACRCHYDVEGCPAPAGLAHNFWYSHEGLNSELSELNACFARWQLRSWKAQEAKRWSHWQIWENALRGVPDVTVWPAKTNISPFVFPIRVPPERFATVTQLLFGRGVEVRSLMGGPIHHQPAFRNLAHSGLQNCEAMGNTTFFVGIHQTLETEEVRRAAAIVREVLEKP